MIDDPYAGYLAPGSNDWRGHELNTLWFGGLDIWSSLTAGAMSKYRRRDMFSRRRSAGFFDGKVEDMRGRTRRVIGDKIFGPLPEKITREMRTATGSRIRDLIGPDQVRKWGKHAATAKFLRGFGIVGFAAFALDLGLEVGRPGIRSIQERDEQKLLQQTFQDSARSYQQRTNAIAAIHDSQMRLRPLLGSESAYMHQ